MRLLAQRQQLLFATRPTEDASSARPGEQAELLDSSATREVTSVTPAREHCCAVNLSRLATSERSHRTRNAMSMKLVKQLRQATGARLVDCKAAVEATTGLGGGLPVAAREGREPRGEARDAHGRARPAGGARFEWPRLPRRGQLGDGLRRAQRRVPALRARPRGRRAAQTTRRCRRLNETRAARRSCKATRSRRWTSKVRW